MHDLLVLYFDSDAQMMTKGESGTGKPKVLIL